MGYFPLFADLNQRAVLIVGGGEVAARKVTLLRKAHADIRIVAQALTPELSTRLRKQELTWLAKQFTPAQIDDVFLVIAATDDHALNARIEQAAEMRHRLVNVVDNPNRCSFIVPAIVDRSPIMIALSSAGKAPVLIRMLRERLEALLPTCLGRMADMAGDWRERVKQRFHTTDERRHFWERAFKGPFARAMLHGSDKQAEHCLAQALDRPTAPDTPQGEVVLVGAGPGDAGLLTLRGLQVIQEADVVLFDQLVGPDVLELIRRDAYRINTGKRAGHHSMSQARINALLVGHALRGKRVVRLKGGDPMTFGRGGEELQAARAAGLPFQVVPGVTAAAAATAYAGIPLTHRDYAQSVMFVTGHCRQDGIEPDWSVLARHHQTLAVYMGTLRAGHISAQLIEHGRAASTPVAIISKGTLPDQHVLTGTLDQLESLAAQAERPALVVIGEVTTLHDELSWFTPHHSPESQTAPLVTLA